MNVQIPWCDVIVGHHVWNAEHGWMQVAARHPHDPLRFRLLDGIGNLHDVKLPPQQQVHVSAPNPDQAIQILESVFGHMRVESERIVDPSQRGPGMPRPPTYA